MAATAEATPAPLVAVANNVNPALVHSHRDGDLDQHKNLSAAVTLKLHNTAELNRFLTAVGDPQSVEYHHYLTPQQFTERFGPTQAEVAKVTAFLSAEGLRIAKVSGNRQVVDVEGTATQLESAFSTRIGNYTDSVSHRRYFANDDAPKIPADIAGLVTGIAGLDNHTVLKHNHTSRPKAAAPHDAPGGGFDPATLNAAYDTAPMGANGSGQTVGVWEFDGYQQSNVDTYDQQFGLQTSPEQTVSVDGSNYDGAPGQGQVEVELDIEVIHAIAPAAKQLVYEAPNSDQGEIDMAAQIASEHKVSVTSISWGSCEPDTTPASMKSTDQGLAQGAAEGISFFSASGDDGSADCTRSASGPGVTAVDFPASDPNVTGVGGTTLTASSSGYGSEAAWSGSGGGESTVFDKPSWQTSSGKRTVPDVSSDADPASGYGIYSAGSWTSVGGTSAAAPMWAGFALLYNSKAASPLGAANQRLYAVNGQGFHDVTSGSNGGFSAGAGYDQVTGWGSYDANALYTALGK